jgi:hypothetical protein
MVNPIAKKIIENFKYFYINIKHHLFGSLRSININKIKYNGEYSSPNFSSYNHNHDFLKKEEIAEKAININNKAIKNFSFVNHSHDYLKNNLNVKKTEDEIQGIRAQQLSKKSHVHSFYVKREKKKFTTVNKMYKQGNYYSVKRTIDSKEHIHNNFIKFSGKSTYAKGLYSIIYINKQGNLEYTKKVLYPEDISLREHHHNNFYLTKNQCLSIFAPKDFQINRASGFMDDRKYKISIYRYKPSDRKTMHNVNTFPVDFMSTKEFETKYLSRPAGSVFKYMDAEKFAYGYNRNTITDFISSSKPFGDLNDIMNLDIQNLFNQPFIPGNENTGDMMNGILWDTNKKIDGESYNDVFGSAASTKFLVGFFNKSTYDKLTNDGPKTLVEYDLDSSVLTAPVYESFKASVLNTENDPDLGQVELNPQEKYVYDFADSNKKTRTYSRTPSLNKLDNWLKSLSVYSNRGTYPFSTFTGGTSGSTSAAGDPATLAKLDGHIFFRAPTPDGEEYNPDDIKSISGRKFVYLLDHSFFDDYDDTEFAFKLSESSSEIYGFTYEKQYQRITFDAGFSPTGRWQYTYYDHVKNDWKDVLELKSLKAYDNVPPGSYYQLEEYNNTLQVKGETVVTENGYLSVPVNYRYVDSEIRGVPKAEVEYIAHPDGREKSQYRIKGFTGELGKSITLVAKIMPDINQQHITEFKIFSTGIKECIDGNSDQGLCISASNIILEAGVMSIEGKGSYEKTLSGPGQNGVYYFKDPISQINEKEYHFFLEGKEYPLYTWFNSQTGKYQTQVTIPAVSDGNSIFALVRKENNDVTFYQVLEEAETVSSDKQYVVEKQLLSNKIQAPTPEFKALDKRKYYWHYSVPSKPDYGETSNVFEYIMEAASKLADNLLNKIFDIFIMALLFLDYFLCWSFNYILAFLDNVLINIIKPFYTFVFWILIQVNIPLLFTTITITLVNWKIYPFIGLLRPLVASFIDRKPFVPISRFISSNPQGNNIVIFSKEYTTNFHQDWNRITGVQKVFNSPYTVLNNVKINKDNGIDFISSTGNYNFNDADDLAKIYKFWSYKIPIAKYYRTTKITNAEYSVKTIQGKHNLDQKYLSFSVDSGLTTTISNYGAPFTLISFEENNDD